MPARKSYVGETFGRLTILEDGLANDKVLCKCECGKQVRTRRNSVTTGAAKSCGCYNNEVRRETGKKLGKVFGQINGKLTKHGLFSHPLYNCHHNALVRCHNPNHAAYPRYGALGVTVCERWRGDNGLEHFIEDKFDTWFEGAELDKDKFSLSNQSKCYSPETTCWVTREENTFIRDNSHLYPISRLSTFDPFISFKLATT